MYYSWMKGRSGPFLVRYLGLFVVCPRYHARMILGQSHWRLTAGMQCLVWGLFALVYSKVISYWRGIIPYYAGVYRAVSGKLLYCALNIGCLEVLSLSILRYTATSSYCGPMIELELFLHSTGYEQGCAVLVLKYHTLIAAGPKDGCCFVLVRCY